MANELQALGRLAPEALDIVATTPAQGVHRAVADRVFRGLGPVGAPVRLAHDAIATGVYTAIRAGATALGVAAASTAKLAAGARDVRPISTSTKGAIFQAAVNGLIGDRLEQQRSDLRIAMAVRHQGHDVPLHRPDLERVFPDAQRRVAVFVHGLGETEDAWRLRVRAGRDAEATVVPERATYGSRLRGELGYTPVFLRFNSGLHTSDSGRRLSALLAALLVEWPCDIDEIALVGHSMGGLVIRAACHDAQQTHRAWVNRVRHVAFLGTPHLGAPLERAVNAAGWALRALPESRPFAVFLETRSAGIKDLRYGLLCDEDWRDADPDELLRDNRIDLPLLPDAEHLFVCATLGRKTSGPLATIIGDLLVNVASATGADRLPIAADAVRHVPGMTHFALLNHPDVYTHLRAFLDEPRPAPKQLPAPA